MGTLTLSDFQSEILAALGNRQDITATQVTIALNLAQARLGRVYDFSDMARLEHTNLNFTGIPASDKYMSLPAHIKTIHSTVLVDNSTGGSLWSSRKMIEKPWRWFDSQFPVPEAMPPEWPSVYTRWGNIIIMAPPPQAAYDIYMRIIAWPTPFTTSSITQTSDFDNKDDILLEDALRHFWRRLGRMDQADVHEKRVERLVVEAVEREDTRPDMDVAADITAIGLNTIEYWDNPFVNSAP